MLTPISLTRMLLLLYCCRAFGCVPFPMTLLDLLLDAVSRPDLSTHGLRYLYRYRLPTGCPRVRNTRHNATVYTRYLPWLTRTTWYNMVQTRSKSGCPDLARWGLG